MIVSELPEKIEIPAAWVGSEIGREPERWRWNLSPAEAAELENTAQVIAAKGNDTTRLSPDEFPLPMLQGKFRRLRETLVNGIGFEVIRGVPVDNPDLAPIIFAGIGSHIGQARSQNADGHLLGHVCDTGANSRNPETRIYQTNERQTFHTDSADVVGLLCLNEARSGGESMLVSAATIYNQFRRQRPDLLKYLFREIATDRRGEVPSGEKPFFTIPVLSWYRGFLTVIYQRQYIDSAQRFSDAPRLGPRQTEALDLFDKLANDPLLHFKVRLRRGDMQFVYNHNLLHDRTGFVDWPERDRRRHLLRLWLSVPGDRTLPEYFSQRFGSVEIGNRGGVAPGKVGPCGRTGF